MHKLQTWLERLYEQKICREFDRVVPVVADEGMGKSTLMLELTGRWKRIKGEEALPEAVLDRVVWDDRTEFKNALAEYPRRAAIPVMDAAHVLYKRESMQPDQIEVEKGLLDVRTREFLILLGFQAWGDIPTTIQERRAKNVLRIPVRGRVEGYSRATLNEKVESCSDDEWPQPDMRGEFPSLEGTDLWAEFKRRDREHKRGRLKADDGEDDEEIDPQVRAALQAVKPWDDDAGMTYKEAAKLTEYSYGWVRDRVHEWREGEYRGVVQAPPQQTA